MEQPDKNQPFAQITPAPASATSLEALVRGFEAKINQLEQHLLEKSAQYQA